MINISTFAFLRFDSSMAFPRLIKKKMKSWQIHQYGSIEELQLGQTRLPIITHPDQVIIKVSAASVNPIDTAMMRMFLTNFYRYES